ncbi:MAG: hypothetical protein ABW250_11220 [Pyrinomonadaceae bacterium]
MDIKRRRFISNTLAGGIALATTARGQQAPPSVTQLSCSAVPSPADALDSYHLPVTSIQAELVYQTYKESSEALRRCNDIFDDIAKEVGELEKAIRRQPPRPRVRAEVRHMSELTDAGRAQVGMIKAVAGGPRDSRASVAPIIFVAAEVGRKAEELLPPGENRLGDEATRHLNNIVKIVRASIPVNDDLKTKQASADERASHIRAELNGIIGLLSAASGDVDAAEKPGSGGNSQSRSKAAEKAQAAADKLGALKKYVQGRELTPESSETIDSLIMLIGGTSYWISQPEQVISPTVSKAEPGFRFEHAAYARAAAAPMPLLLQSVETILGEHCSRDSLGQVTILVQSILLPTRGWKAARLAAARLALSNPPTPNEVREAVELALRRCARLVNSRCGRAANFSNLAAALWPLI